MASVPTWMPENPSSRPVAVRCHATSGPPRGVEQPQDPVTQQVEHADAGERRARQPAAR